MTVIVMCTGQYVESDLSKEIISAYMQSDSIRVFDTFDPVTKVKIKINAKFIAAIYDREEWEKANSWRRQNA